MLDHWKKKLAVVLASAAVLAGCSDNSTIQRADAQAARGQPVSISGCVSVGIGSARFMLTHVRFAPLGAPSRDAGAYAGTGLTEGAPVRLASENDDQVGELLGQMASVTGTLSDDGRNTIGTTGPARGPNDPEPQKDRSEQASKDPHWQKVAKEAGPMGTRSMNNGTFPEVRVEQISGNGQPCPTKPIEDKR